LDLGGFLTDMLSLVTGFLLRLDGSINGEADGVAERASRRLG